MQTISSRGQARATSVSSTKCLGDHRSGHGELSQCFSVCLHPHRALIVCGCDGKTAPATRFYAIEIRVRPLVKSMGMTEEGWSGKGAQNDNVQQTIERGCGGGDGQTRSEGVAICGRYEPDTRRGKRFPIDRKTDPNGSVSNRGTDRCAEVAEAWRERKGAPRKMPDNCPAQTGGGDVDGIPLLLSSILRSVANLQEVERTDPAAVKLVHCLEAPGRRQRMAKVASGATRNKNEDGRWQNGGPAFKEAVHHLVQGPVATHCQNTAHAGLQGFTCKGRGSVRTSRTVDRKRRRHLLKPGEQAGLHPPRSLAPGRRIHECTGAHGSQARPKHG